MIRQLGIGGLALLASASGALAQTQVTTGDKGFNRQVLQGAELYDVLNATVLVEQGRNNTGYNIARSPGRGMFLGGRTLGRGINRTTPWRAVYDQGNGACIRFENSPEFTIRRHYGEFCWDGLKPVNGSRNWVIEDSWLKHIRDDAIEADHAGAHDGKVRRTFFEGVHTFLSVTPGNNGSVQGHVRIEFHDNVMSLGCGLDNGRACENRDKRLKYAWSRPTGSGQAFKVNGCGEDIDILFRNNSVMMETGLNTSGSNLAIFQCMKVLPGSTGNTFYWLGGCNFRGLEMERIDGACVPERFELDPAVWTHVSNNRAAWQAEVARWQAQVWKGGGNSLEPEVSEPEPTEPEPDVASEPKATEPETTEPDDDTGEILVAVDVRQEQCPNRVRVNRDKSFPVVVTGTSTFDVRDINPESIRLAGAPPRHHRTRYSDRATPYEPAVGKRDDGDCTRKGPDGIEDLLLRFSSGTLGKALGRVANKTTLVVPLTGELEDGTPIRGEDVIIVLN